MFSVDLERNLCHNLRMGKKRRSQARQLTFEDRLGRKNRGGRPKSKDSGVPHLKRDEVSPNAPLHVTSKIVSGLPDLRTRKGLQVFYEVFEVAKERAGSRADGEFRLLHYSIQGNHLHLFVEAGDRDALARGIQGLKVRIAKALNRLWQRSGAVWADRYHVRAAKTPREVRNVLGYILNNGRRHGRTWNRGYPDPYSSALWFDGWSNYVHDGLLSAEGPIAKARSWLARVGWRRHGLLEAALG